MDNSEASDVLLQSPQPNSEKNTLVYTVVKENWLTRKPSAYAGMVIALVTLLVVVASIAFWMDLGNAATWMAASKEAVFHQHQYWRAWTTLLIHGDEKHLLSNISLFFVLGFFLAGHFGLLIVPFSGFLLGGLVNLIVLWRMPAMVELFGLSGVVFWMGGAWLILYFLLETRKTLSQRALRAFGVALVLFMPAEAFDPSISYQSHLWGFLFGVGWGGTYFLAKKRSLRAAEVRETTIEETSGEFELSAETPSHSEL
jgi:rhomboid protease GluP